MRRLLALSFWMGSIFGLGAPSAGCRNSGALADAGSSGQPLAVFDLGADFSSRENPHGPWRYGSTSADVLSVTQFQPDSQAVRVGDVDFWHPSGAVYYPYVAHNPGALTVTDASGSWAVRPGQVALEASSAGACSVVQFVAPAAGDYAVHAAFEGIHFRLSTTDVHVRDADAVLFDGSIDGYGGDPAFHPHVGASPSTTYDATLSLRAGEVLSFAVGFGADRTNSNDTTGLVVHIEQRP